MTEWYILPGMGATSEMYDSLKRELNFTVQFIDWPAYQGEVSFKEVAKRVIDENLISENDVVGGSSLGGMIALEISMNLNNKAVVLMGSALLSDEINRLLSMLSPLASITPLSFIQAVAGKNGHVLSRMLSAADTGFVRSMCKYVSQWPGYHGPIDRVFRVHGQNDHIITCPKRDSDLIESAGHLLAITHAKECAAFIERSNRRLT